MIRSMRLSAVVATPSPRVAVSILAAWLLVVPTACLGSEGTPPASTEEAAPMTELIGTWTYAADPRGGDAATTQPIYKASTITFGEGGSYAFKLGSTPKPLTGTATVTEWGESGGILATDYGEGRTNVLHIALHRDGSGEVLGFVVRETEAKINPRYYAR